MNKSAIALAADSAVTIGNHLAVHNSANKLFALSKSAPVGVIMYASANFMSVPFEVIVKQYKKHLGERTFSTLNEYVTDFLTYMTDNCSYFHFDKTEENYIFDVCEDFCNGFDGDFQELHNRAVKKKLAVLDDEELAGIFDTVLSSSEKFVEKLPALDTSFCDYISQKYAESLRNWLKKRYNWVKNETSIDTLQKLLLNCFDKDFFRSGYTGLAFSGYGDSEIYPTLIHLSIAGIINCTPRMTREEDDSVSEKHPSVIKPLAQTDVMETFMLGVSNQVLNSIYKKASKVLREDIRLIPDEFFAAGKKEEVEKKIIGSAERLTFEIVKQAVDESLAPFSIAASSLTISDLAMLAESMINITSFRRKVALDRNIDTVGGPIDVAVISKGEGFVWIKRKHYFSIDNNLQYVLNCLNSQKGCNNEEDKCDD